MVGGRGLIIAILAQRGNDRMAHPGGRPSKYRKEYCDMIIEYFNRQPQETLYKRTYYDNGLIKSEEPYIIGVQFPTFQGFADSIDVNVDTLYEWGRAHNEFSVAITRARELQEKIWLINGMGGQYNSQFAQFFGRNCLGYKDKTSINVEQESPFEVKIITEE